MGQLATLVWKNFKYCKRHPVRTIMFFLFPLMLTSFMFLIVALVNTDDIPDCDYQTIALPPSKPELVLGSLLCQREGQCINSSSPMPYFPPHDLIIQSTVNPALNNTMSSICPGLPVEVAVSISRNYWKYFCDNPDDEDKKIKYRDLTTAQMVFKGKVYYYVRDGAAKGDADKIMNIAQSYLDGIVDLDHPELVNISTPICFIKLADRTYFAESEKAALEMAQNLNEYKDFVWGMVEFISTNKHYQYKLVTQYQRRDKFSTLYLQSMIEAAIIEVETGQKQMVAVEQKLLPKRCMKNDSIYGPTFSVLSMVLGLGFVVIAYTISSEMCFEKQAGLLEFLFIAGVPRWKVRASWIIFGSVFFISVSIIVGLIFKFASPLLFEYTPVTLILLLMILYSISLLCLCVCIASLTSTAQRAGILMFVILMASYLAPAWGQMVPDVGYTGGTLMMVKFLTFFIGPVGAQIAFAYILGMEKLEQGVTWGTLRASPSPEDMYGGVAEILFYFILQCPMYLLFSWYFDKVAPSKYGLKWPIYFCCMPSFWGCKEKHHGAPVEGQNEADIEPPSSEKTPGISVQNLTKQYSNKFIALNKLSVTFYQNEITAFLGHNGAGKSTTMNMLTGMIAPSSGTAIVDGFDIWRNMKEIRQKLGFCPQYDIVYPELSVNEHMIFYGDLKGIPRDDVKQFSMALFEQMKMMHALDTAAMSLSGGMKRKLSIAIAFIGSPTTVILDEPTSAIDPFSRRAIWDAVLQYRSKATVLISTHYMQEADVLGDRIAIIDKGELKCFGSPMYLKTRYGDGSKIVIAHDGVIDEKALQSELQMHIPVKLQSSSTSGSTYSIPIEAARSEKLVDAFNYLEENGEQWNILSFGISESTMEQVFFNVAEGGGTNDAQQNGDIQTESLLGKVEYKNLSGISLMMMQLWATWVKRFHISRRSWVALIFQVLVPLMFMVILLLMNNLIASAGISGQTEIMHVWNTTSLPRNTFFIATHNPDFSAVLSKEGLGTKCMKQTLISKDNVNTNEADMGFKCLNMTGVELPPVTVDGEINDCECSKCSVDAVVLAKNVTTNSNDTLLNLLNRNITNYLLKSLKDGVIGGIELFQVDFVNFFDKFSKMQENAKAGKEEENDNNIEKNFTIDHILQMFTRMNLSSKLPAVHRIWTGLKIKNERRPTKQELDMESMKSSFLNVYSNLRLKASKLQDSQEYGITLFTEEQSMNKEISIADRISGFLLGFFGHFALMMPTFTVLLVIVNERAAGNKQLQIVMGLNQVVYWIANFIWDMLLFLLSVCLMIGFMSIFPKVFDTKLHVFFFISMMYGCSMILLSYVLSFLLNTARNAIMVIGNMAPYFAIACMVMLAFQAEEWYEDVNFGLAFLPPYFITEALIAMEINKVMPDAEPVLSWDVMGKRFAISGIFSLLMLTLLICLESGMFNAISQGMKNRKSGAIASAQSDKDPDVAKEEEKILSQKSPENQALVVEQLVKAYGKNVAVKGVSFGVSKGECFGLLGVNGAGKTTLFKMLTRFHNPTHGDARILGMSVFNRAAEAAKHMSYCPQEDCIFETLTAGEHLHLYGRIRGIPSDQRDEVVELLIDEVGLSPHRKKQSHSLSGGNKRKLNFAISVVDFPDVIFLDEMTTGMDPKARRAAWMCLERAIARGCSAIITSHSMEECEALCNRLVIMVNGTFKCIGGVQYLKDKYGNNYNAKFRLGTNGDAQKLSWSMMDKFAKASLVEEHLGYLELQIPANSLKLSSLFEAIHSLKKDCDIEEFSVSQTTLEHVFVNMVRDQE